MLTDLDLPLSLWAEVVGVAVYIQNRSPHAILGEETPEEVFTKKKPAVDHMRIFGTPVTNMCQRKRGPSYSLLIRKLYFLNTVIARRPTVSMYLDRGTLKSAEM